MYCKKCGAKIPEGYRFCPKCGTNIPVGESTEQKTTTGTDTPKPYSASQSTESTEQTSKPEMPESKPLSRPNNYLLWAILVTIFCCIPLGVVGIVYALKVDSAWDAGLYGTAEEYSKKAKNWTLWGAIISVLIYIIYIVVIVGLLGLGVAFSDLTTI